MTIFLGRGPPRLADGSLNPNALGVLITNGVIGLVRTAGGGTFTLSFQKTPTDPVQTTAPLPTAQRISSAGRSRWAFEHRVNNVLVTKSATSYTVTFQNALATTDLTGLTINAGRLAGPDRSPPRRHPGIRVHERRAASDAASRRRQLTLSFHKSANETAQTTTPIAYNATASAVQSALESLPNIGAGNVLVSGNAGGPYTITFQNTLGNQSLPTLGSNGSLLLPLGKVVTTTAGNGSQSLVQEITVLTTGGPGYALQASGTVSLVGLNGVTLAGTATVRFNSTGQIVNESIPIAGGSPVLVNFPSASQVAELSVTGGTLEVLGQSIFGDFSFNQSTNAAGEKVVTVAVASAALVLGGGLVSVLNAQGLFAIASAGVAGELQGTLQVGAAPDMQLGAGFSIAQRRRHRSTSVPLSALGRLTCRRDLTANPGHERPDNILQKVARRRFRHRTHRQRSDQRGGDEHVRIDSATARRTLSALKHGAVSSSECQRRRRHDHGHAGRECSQCLGGTFGVDQHHRHRRQRRCGRRDDNCGNLPPRQIRQVAGTGVSVEISGQSLSAISRSSNRPSAGRRSLSSPSQTLL